MRRAIECAQAVCHKKQYRAESGQFMTAIRAGNRPKCRGSRSQCLDWVETPRQESSCSVRFHLQRLLQGHRAMRSATRSALRLTTRHTGIASTSGYANSQQKIGNSDRPQVATGQSPKFNRSLR